MARPTSRLGLFDLGIAAFAAVAVGFAAAAMPEWRLFSLLKLTGLPDLLAAANPPLGLKARFGVATLLAAAAFGSVFLLMRLLDRVPARRTAEEFDEEAQAVNLPIRLRRADAHPDNPARRPLIAGRELGEPFDELILDTPADVAPAPEPAPRGLPSFLVPDDEPPVAASRGDEPLVPPSRAEPLVPTRRADEETVDFVEIVAPPAPIVRTTPPPTFQPVAHQAPEPTLQGAPRDAAIVAPIEAAPVAEPAVAASPANWSTAADESISDLMARLESGLRRRERAVPGAAHPPVPTSDGNVADRLRTAMTDLQKLAARG